MLLNDTEIHGRQIKVSPQRTNVPGMKARRPGGRGRGAMGFMPPFPPFDPFGYSAMMMSMMGGRRPFRGYAPPRACITLRLRRGDTHSESESPCSLRVRSGRRGGRGGRGGGRGSPY